jgi:hypothetical protein
MKDRGRKTEVGRQKSVEKDYWREAESSRLKADSHWLIELIKLIEST